MAFGNNSKKTKPNFGQKGSKKSDDTPPAYVTIMQVLEGENGEYVKANNYKGRLIWQAYGGENGDDPEQSTLYEVLTAFIGTPHEKAPEFVKGTIVVNLNNPKAAEALEAIG